MKRLLGMVLCVVFLFTSFASFAEVAPESVQQTDVSGLPALPVKDAAPLASPAVDAPIPAVIDAVYPPAEPVIQAPTIPAVPDEAYAPTDLEKLTNITDFETIVAEQDSVVNSIYKYKVINNKNVVMAMLTIKKYLNSRDRYYQAELLKIKLAVVNKNKDLANKAIAAIEKRFANQSGKDKIIHSKLIEIQKYLKSNMNKLSKSDKATVNKELKAILIKFNNHKLLIEKIKTAVKNAKITLKKAPAVKNPKAAPANKTKGAPKNVKQTKVIKKQTVTINKKVIIKKK